ncbi:hypothetical protein OK074_6959 [Actinobacteria bacterium OK074]|nr:hypothetical protein OK074_6959 [Actinobacteria bacterium OK074]
MAGRSAASPHWPVVALVLWGLTRLLPPGANRRRVPTAMRAVMTGENAKERARLVARVPARCRSPYSTDRAPLDGSASRLVRPYLPGLDAHPADQSPDVATSPRPARVRPYWPARERVARWGRRTALVLAADFGVDLDTRDIHAVAVGGEVR